MRIRRPYEFAITIGADSKDALIGHLYDMARRLEREEISHGCVGGADLGSIYSFCYDGSITHDRYFELVNRHIEENKAANSSRRPSRYRSRRSVVTRLIT